MKKLLFLFTAFFISCLASEINQAVTYELSPGRFGDNLLSYIHAKWISYKYKLPLLYKPFIYSDHLKLHEIEQRYTSSSSFSKIITLGKKVSVNPEETGSLLYFVPYFPQSKWELHCAVSFKGTPWDYFEIDWNDKGFIEKLREVIVPRNPIAPLNVPQDRITVAIHVRRGGNHDTPDVPPCFPLKFLPNEFYIEQIKELYALLHGKPLYVYLFTDDNNPAAIITSFKQNILGLNIQFDCRAEGNSDTTHVIEDFFAMQQFDCLIHSESNFSLIMSKIGNYLVSIFPDEYHKENGNVIYDHISVSMNAKNVPSR